MHVNLCRHIVEVLFDLKSKNGCGTHFSDMDTFILTPQTVKLVRKLEILKNIKDISIV